jgi:uncharacterized damage-inducible protein DinB
MNPTVRTYDFAAEILASEKFFARSTMVLDELDSEFRPREEMMTVAQHVAHTAHTLNWFIDGVTRPEGFDLDFQTQATKIAEAHSVEEARRNLHEAYLRVIDFLRSKTPEELEQPLPPGPIMGGSPMRAIFGAMMEHTAHHRGALTVYARLLNKVPAMPYGA